MAVTGLLVAIAGIMLPAIQYVSSILPGQRLLERAESIERTLETRFAELSARLANDQIEQAIQNVTSETPHERQVAVTHLALNTHYPFTRHHIADLAEAARSVADIRGSLLSILARHRSPLVTRLFLDLLHDPDLSFFQIQGAAMTHVDLATSPQLGDLLKAKWLEQNNGGLQLLSMAIGMAPTFFSRLANDAEVIASIDRNILATTVNAWLLTGMRRQIFGTELGKMFNVHESP